MYRHTQCNDPLQVLAGQPTLSKHIILHGQDSGNTSNPFSWVIWATASDQSSSNQAGSEVETLRLGVFFQANPYTFALLFDGSRLAATLMLWLILPFQ